MKVNVHKIVDAEWGPLGFRGDSWTDCYLDGGELEVESGGEFCTLEDRKEYRALTDAEIDWVNNNEFDWVAETFNEWLIGCGASVWG